MSPRFKVYLAGPIAGLTYDEGRSWRTWVDEAMPGCIVCYSPLRGKETVFAGACPTRPLHHHPLATDRAIMARDYNDVFTADLVLAHLAGAAQASVGTIMELAWAHGLKKPVVGTLDDGGPHDHPMIREAITHRAVDLRAAVALACAVLLP